jgi:hypothetical protein
MLRMVPRAPARISAKQLCERLGAAEFEVVKRTVKRAATCRFAGGDGRHRRAHDSRIRRGMK